LFAGVWVDRVRRRPVLVGTDLGRAALLLLVPLGAWFGFLGIELLVGVAVAAGVMTILFDVAYRSYLPVLVERGRLVEGNSKLAATDAAAEIGGPALVGVVVQLITAPLAILIDALSFLWSALMVGLIRKREAQPAKPQRGSGNVREQIGQGMRAVLHHPVLFSLAGYDATKTFFGGFYAALYGLFVIRDLHLGPFALGVAVAAGGVGDLIGALVAGRAARRAGLGAVLIGTAVISGLVGLLTPLASGPTWRALAMLATGQLVGDMMRSIFIVHQISLRQTVTPDHLLGRVNASNTFLTLGMLPIGAITAGLLGTWLGARATILIAVLGGLIATLWLARPAIRRLRSHHETDTAYRASLSSSL
jgi:predicted MFS family arabinose efflux permease